MRIRELVLVGLCACSDGTIYQGGQPEHHDLTVTDPSPPMQLRIESCRVDVDACQELCNAAVRANGLFGQVTTCSVTFDSGGAYVGVDLVPFATGGGVP